MDKYVETEVSQYKDSPCVGIAIHHSASSSNPNNYTVANYMYTMSKERLIFETSLSFWLHLT